MNEHHAMKSKEFNTTFLNAPLGFTLKKSACGERSEDDTAMFLLKKLKKKTPETFEHSVRVSNISMHIGIRLGLNLPLLKTLYWGSLLHDIGKLSIPDDILTAQRKLSEKEFKAIIRHTLLGHELLNSTSLTEKLKEIALLHHERIDGKGYPYGIKNVDIPLLAKICSIADSYDAMTAKRCYRSSVDEASARKELLRCAGTQFDPSIVNEFMNCTSI